VASGKFSLLFNAFDLSGHFTSHSSLQGAQAKEKRVGNGKIMRMGLSLSIQNHLQHRRIQCQKNIRIFSPLERAWKASQEKRTETFKLGCANTNNSPNQI
jgi:hypothetical protein